MKLAESQRLATCAKGPIRRWDFMTCNILKRACVHNRVDAIQTAHNKLAVIFGLDEKITLLLTRAPPSLLCALSVPSPLRVHVKILLVLGFMIRTYAYNTYVTAALYVHDDDDDAPSLRAYTLDCV